MYNSVFPNVPRVCMYSSVADPDGSGLFGSPGSGFAYLLNRLFTHPLATDNIFSRPIFNPL